MNKEDLKELQECFFAEMIGTFQSPNDFFDWFFEEIEGHQDHDAKIYAAKIIVQLDAEEDLSMDNPKVRLIISDWVKWKSQFHDEYLLKMYRDGGDARVELVPSEKEA